MHTTNLTRRWITDHNNSNDDAQQRSNNNQRINVQTTFNKHHHPTSTKGSKLVSRASSCLFLAITIVSFTYYSMSIPNSARSIRYNMRHSSRSSETSSSSSSTEKKKCALLFFGLIKDSYESISLPSIQKHILQKNDQCDIFLHTYNLTTVPLNRKNGELTAQTVNVSKGAYLLTHHVILDNMDTFYIQRNKTLERTRTFYHVGWGECCTSHDNMMKQWHSIERVWNLMQTYEKSQNFRYSQVGLFRSDVYYTKSIDIFDSDGAVPGFASHNGYNDRMFYGLYDNAKIWASERFNFVDVFEKTYMKPCQYSEYDWFTKVRVFFGYKVKHGGYHSESFVKHLMDHHGVRVELKDHCLWREVRSGRDILVGDCNGMDGFFQF